MDGRFNIWCLVEGSPGRISRGVGNLYNATAIANVRLVNVSPSSEPLPINTGQCYYLPEWNDSKVGLPVRPVGPTSFQLSANGSIDAAPVVYLADPPSLLGNKSVSSATAGPTPSKCIVIIHVQKLKDLFLLQFT